MKRTHLFGTMMACTLAAAVSVGAQERPTTSPSDRESKTVVVTGCLKSGTPAASTAATPSTPGTAGTAGSSASARGSFIITDAVVAADTASTTGAAGTASPTGATPAGTSGTTPSTAAPSGKTYALIGGQQTELQGLVNSKVEIRGTLNPSADRSAAPTTGAPPTTTPPTTTPPTGTPSSGAGMSGMSHADHGQLRVTSVKQLAGSCSGQ